MDWNRLLLITAVALQIPAVALAQHPIDVQRRAAMGEPYQSLVAFEKMPKRKATTEARIAAAKSAWALSLPDRAVEEFETALRDKNLSDEQRARMYLSRGIIEYQEGRDQVSLLYARRAADLLKDPGPLRSRVWNLWAELLARGEEYGAAAEKYGQALSEAPQEDMPDIYFGLGVCQLKLGKDKDARDSFEHVPLNHDRTPEAIRHLARIALGAGNHQDAAFWLTKGRSEYPDSFLDSWVDYALLQIAVKQNNREQVRDIRARAQAKYPPSDIWLNLLDAEAEAFEWSIQRYRQ